MASLKRRYYFWLMRAYLVKMRKTIISSLIIGIIVFFSIIGLFNYYVRPLIIKPTDDVGFSGTYTLQTLPNLILFDISYGLTKVGTNGDIVPGAAERWNIKDGKIYTFKLKKNIYFHNGEELTSENINYNFGDVSAKKIDKYTIQYTLKNPYSPFLVTVSRPIFGKNLSGIGKYKVTDVDINAGFLRTLTISDTTSKSQKRKIYFYPTQKALKVAFLLGEVKKIYGVLDTTFNSQDIAKWNKVKSESYINYNSLVAIFYNNDDPILNNKKIRQALNYSLPQSLQQNERAYRPIPPKSIYYYQSPTYKISDIELAKTILSGVDDPPKDPLTISTSDEYLRDAEAIQDAWQKLGIKSKIKIVSDIPRDFQVFLYRIKIPLDPDQYVLWHSDQANNITHYKSMRIDKLLEDGRSITDVEKRKKLYADFQKYLNDDVPASFYYFPKEYNLIRI